MEFAEKSPVFEKAVDVLTTVSADDYNRMLYEARLKEWRDNKSRIDGALAKCKFEIACKLKGMGFSASQIAEVTGLSEKEI